MLEGKVIGKDEGFVEGEIKGKKEGILEGKIKGKSEEKIKIAKNLLEIGLEIEKVALATGLSKDQIENIK